MSRDWTFLTWREKTWGERGWTVLGNIAGTIVAGIMFVGAFYVLGQIIDTQDARRTERHNCLKHATNGLEIERCR